jgi:hypothetical protein
MLKTRLEIKRIELFSLFKIAFFIYSIIGFFVGLIYGTVMVLAGGLNMAFLGEDFPEMGMLGIIFGVLAVPVAAMVYGTIGSVFVTIGGAIFNLIAGAVGGLRLVTEVHEAYGQKVNEAAPPPTPQAEEGSITPPGGPTLKRSTFLDE